MPVTSENSVTAIPAAPPPRRQIQTWQDAEHNAAAWMRHWGHRDAQAKPGGADGGIDVRSRSALGQVKYQAAAVGRPELQNLFGARGHDMRKQLFFFTGSSYAATAVEYADRNDIALFVYALDGRMRPVNGTARRVGRPPAPARPAAAAPPRTPQVPTDPVPVNAPGGGTPTVGTASDRSSVARRQRWAIAAFLTVVVVGGGIVPAVQKHFLRSGRPAGGLNQDVTSRPDERPSDPAALLKDFKAFTASRGTAQDQAVVEHVVAITESASPAFVSTEIETDYPAMSTETAEGERVSSLFTDFRKTQGGAGRTVMRTVSVYSATHTVLFYTAY
ncbi:restriction endonuclease [Peterkaempfera griseoplana]|uniref:restriction endonuclease n=1 Tax=Peterkaempfera griseoplana TaxID=66896 RepID=UPI00099EAC5C|nr:restriction endonuclease [Peterkaempfera griseoplana]